MAETKIICEVASSHNGDLDLAKAIIKAGAENSCDFIKFQSWEAKNIPDTDPDKKRYEKYEFKKEWYKELIPYCQSKGVEFLTSCFNVDRVEFLASLGLKKIKIASISAFNRDLMSRAGAHFEELIVSTGTHTQEEIEDLIDWLATNAQKFTIMACTAEYPCPLEHAGLARIDSLKEITKDMEYASVGYSDHSLDLDVAKTAIAMGVKYLEKHFSLSRYLPQIPHQMFENGPLITTHQVSIEPHELRELADWRDKVELMKSNGEFQNYKIENKIKDRYLRRYGV